MQARKRKKVLFFITKSNWGEKCWGHFARLAQLFCEGLEQKGVRAETELAFCFRRLPAIFEKNSDNLYSICKMDSRSMRAQPPHMNVLFLYAS